MESYVRKLVAGMTKMEKNLKNYSVMAQFLFVVRDEISKSEHLCAVPSNG